MATFSLSLRSFSAWVGCIEGHIFSKIQWQTFVQNRLRVKIPRVGCLERVPDEVKIYEVKALSTQLAGPGHFGLFVLSIFLWEVSPCGWTD